MSVGGSPKLHEGGHLATPLFITQVEEFCPSQVCWSKHGKGTCLGAVAHVPQHGCVGLNLDGIELGFSEVTHGKGAPNAKPVDGLAEDLTAPARKPA